MAQAPMQVQRFHLPISATTSGDFANIAKVNGNLTVSEATRQ
jgi:hypothetical protein